MAIKILGIDPGSRVTGYAILSKKRAAFNAVACGVIRLTHQEEPFDRLLALYSEITSLISTHSPDSCAIETPVYGNDPSAMLKLGRAQAAIMMAVLHQNIPLAEYYPKAVKKAITGTGNASKQQVAYMLHKLIDISEDNLTADATDALAVAWCHYQKTGNFSIEKSDSERRQNLSGKNTWSAFIKKHPERINRP